MTAPRVAFYAPMKAPGHPVPSGDREIARLTVAALERAGFAPEVVSDLRLYDGAGDAAVQVRLEREAAAEAARLADALAADRPALWFTYHCYYKAPDLLGPAVAGALGVPYVISEPSISPRRREGPWARFAEASEAAIGAADLLFWTTARDRPALQEAGFGCKMMHLPAFLDPGAEVAPRPAGTPLRLLTVAMMRPGEKLESYRRLAQGLEALDGAGRAPAAPVAWVLDVHGDGPLRAEVETLFAGVAGKVTFHGESDAARVRRACEETDLMVWPGVGEGVGMAYLEAQAAGLPVVAEDHAAQREVVCGELVAPDDARAFAAAIRRAAVRREVLSGMVRTHVVARHSLDAAARRLREALEGLIR